MNAYKLWVDFLSKTGWIYNKDRIFKTSGNFVIIETSEGNSYHIYAYNYKPSRLAVELQLAKVGKWWANFDENGIYLERTNIVGAKSLAVVRWDSITQIKPY